MVTASASYAVGRVAAAVVDQEGDTAVRTVQLHAIEGHAVEAATQKPAFRCSGAVRGQREPCWIAGSLRPVLRLREDLFLDLLFFIAVFRVLDPKNKRGGYGPRTGLGRLKRKVRTFRFHA